MGLRSGSLQPSGDGRLGGALLTAAALCALSLALHLPFVGAGLFDFTHEAVLFKPALDLVEGKMLFKESYCSYGPISVLLIALGIRLFGGYLLVAKVAAAIAASLTVSVLFLTWDRFMARWLALAAALALCLLSWHFVHPYLAWASTFALFFQALSLYGMVLGQQKDKAALFALAGAAACLCCFSKQNVGAYLSVAVVGAIFLLLVARQTPLRRALAWAAAFCAGFAAVLASILGWLAINDALQSWWLQNVVFAAAWARSFGGGFKLSQMVSNLLVLKDINSGPCQIPVILQMMPLGVLAGFLVFSFRFLRRKPTPPRDTALWMMLVACLASWAQFYPVPGIGHVYWSCAPMFGVCFWLLYRAILWCWAYLGLTRITHMPKVVFGLVLAALIIPPAATRYAEAKLRLESFVSPVRQGPLAGIRFSSQEEVQRLDRFKEAFDREINSQAGPHDVVMLGINEPLYLTMVTNHYLFHPLYGDYQLYNDTIYGSLNQELHDHITTFHPAILTDTSKWAKFGSQYPGYVVVFSDPSGLLLVK
ncbi:hypothetical protein [Humidesulfovibrio idahonensis]